MRRELFDLAGADSALRFSPFCWRTRMALAHKGLRVTTIPWRFTDKAAIAHTGSTQVPVLIDGERTVVDSSAIADYLEQAYPERPLFGCDAARALTGFMRNWVERCVFPALVEQIVVDIPQVLAPADVAYFRATREKRFGMSLEAYCASRDASLPAFRELLAPVRVTLASQAYLCGAEPAYADYIVFGALQWARCVSRRELLALDDPVSHWLDRLLDAYDGLGRRAVRVGPEA